MFVVVTISALLAACVFWLNGIGATVIQVASGEWFLRLDSSGHEPTFRTEIRSDGTIRRLRGRKESGSWREIYAGNIEKAELAKIYESTRTVIRDAKPIDRTPVKDVEAFQELTVVTSGASYQLEIEFWNLSKDKSLAERFRNLITLVNQRRRRRPRRGARRCGWRGKLFDNSRPQRRQPRA